MNICSEDHEEIVYMGRGCPLCIALGEIEDLNEMLEDEE